MTFRETLLFILRTNKSHKWTLGMNVLFNVNASGTYSYRVQINGQVKYNYCVVFLFMFLVSFKYSCNYLTPFPRVKRTKSEAAAEVVHTVPRLKIMQILPLLFVTPHGVVPRHNFIYTYHYLHIYIV
jgi:hypothetical protein